MSNRLSSSPAERRDRATGRVRAWTTACVLSAGTLVAVFAALAAAQFPGQDASASSGTSTVPQSSASGDDSGSTSSTSSDSGGQLQGPPSGFFGSGGSGGSSGRHAVSGGS